MDPFMSRIHDGIIEGMTGDLGTEIKKIYTYNCSFHVVKGNQVYSTGQDRY